MAEPTRIMVMKDQPEAKPAGAAPCAPASQETGPAPSILSSPGLARGLVIRAKPERCYACLGCLVACAYAKLGLAEDAPLRPASLAAARLSVEASGGYSVPLLCMQCANAPCMMVCPTGALQRLDPQSPVSADLARCIGCKSCVLACPVGVLSLDSQSRVVQKCDLCLSRAGHVPACVEACPMEALQLVSLDEVIAQAEETAARKLAALLEAAPHNEMGLRGSVALPGEQP